MTNDSGTLGSHSRTADTAASNRPQRSGRSTEALGRQSRRTLKEAEVAVIAAWRSWSAANLVHDKIGDEHVHAFLRHAKAETPDLLVFSSRTTPYETAFGWIVSDHAGLEPIQSRSRPR